jgi:hypothetical protein
MKNPKEKINPSQRQRAWMFQKTGGKYAEKLAIADGREFSFGETKLRFSEAVPHGPEDALLGWVVMATVEFDGERFMYAPDVQGPMSTRTSELIKNEKPDIIMVGGPPFYLGGLKVDERQIVRGIENLQSIVEAVPTTIMEHHALRDEQWHSKAEPIQEAAEKVGHKLVTAADFSGEKNLFLESRRKSLYEESPPSREFQLWTKLDSKEISHVKPPVLSLQNV